MIPFTNYFLLPVSFFNVSEISNQHIFFEKMIGLLLIQREKNSLFLTKLFTSAALLRMECSWTFSKIPATLSASSENVNVKSFSLKLDSLDFSKEFRNPRQDVDRRFQPEPQGRTPRRSTGKKISTIKCTSKLWEWNSDQI